MNCAFKDILRGKNFETNLERDNDSLKFVPNHFCSPTNSVGKMSQKIISCFFWHCSQYVKMGLDYFLPLSTKLNKVEFDIYFEHEPKLSERCFKIDWNIVKWRKENISESESGGQMALTFTLKHKQLVGKTMSGSSSSRSSPALKSRQY